MDIAIAWEIPLIYKISKSEKDNKFIKSIVIKKISINDKRFTIVNDEMLCNIFLLLLKTTILNNKKAINIPKTWAKIIDSDKLINIKSLNNNLDIQLTNAAIKPQKRNFINCENLFIIYNSRDLLHHFFAS